MKNKRRKSLHGYIMFLLMVCILLGLLLDNLTDFFIGFFAGWNEVSSAEEAGIRFGNWGQMVGWAFIGTTLVLICVRCYIKLRKRVTEPVERLAKDMSEVRGGNLAVRASLNGDFEIVDIQEAFNSMVEELEGAKKLREMTEQRNQQLYAGIAHDLKTPMTMIMGYAKLLEQDVAVTEENKKRYIQTIIQHTEHTNTLLDSLLAYTKLQNQSYQLKKEKGDIVECLRECIANYYAMLEEAEIQADLKLPDREILCFFDRVEMKRVFANLLTNIVKHNPKKTSCLIQLEDIGDIENGCKRIEIIMADDGPKIAETLQKNVFDSFVVGDVSRNTKNGSGLGLAISKSIVERHHGSLCYINSWKNGWKCFKIVLDIE